MVTKRKESKYANQARRGCRHSTGLPSFFFVAPSSLSTIVNHVNYCRIQPILLVFFSSFPLFSFSLRFAAVRCVLLFLLLFTFYLLKIAKPIDPNIVSVAIMQGPQRIQMLLRQKL